jgi:hypothetical protein
MNPNDDLSELWRSQPEHAADTAALLREVQRRMGPFERCIRRRDLREQAAGALLVVIFAWLAFHAHSAWSLATDVWLGAYGLWIIYYLRRHSRALREASPECSLAEYRALVLERYQQQIRILRRAKYWYVAPFWIGMMMVSWAAYRGTGSLAVLVVDGLAFSATAAVLCWVNEGPGVRKVQQKLHEVMAVFGNEGEA